MNVSQVTFLDDALAQKWDRYVAQHTEGTAYHRVAWLQAVRDAYKFDYMSWVVFDDKQDIVGLLAAVKMSKPVGVLCALPYCDVGGVLADSNEISELLVRKALDYSIESSFSKFEHRCCNRDIEVSSAPKVRMVLPLPESSESLWSGFKSKLRSQVNKAKKNGLTATIGYDEQQLKNFYRVYARNMRDLGSPAHSAKWFEAIQRHYGKDALIANVFLGDQVVGAGIVLKNGAKFCIPWASTVAEFNRLAPNMLLYWTLLEATADAGGSEFDFGRSTPGEGTFKFKAQWGAQPIALDWRTYQNGTELSEHPHSSSSARALVEKSWRKLPLGVATFIGSRIRKYISL